MKIVRLTGGLGNQMLQYILYKYLETRTGDMCYLDTSRIGNPRLEHNGLELDKIFNIKPLWLHELFSPGTWEILADEMRNHRILKYAESLGIKMNIITDDGSKQEYFEATGHENLYNIPVSVNGRCNVRSVDFAGHCYYAGYWLTDTFFNDISNIMLKEFTFPKFDERNQEIADDMSSCASVGIHVRRTGFVTDGREVGAEYYTLAVSTVKRSIRNPVFYVFSDEIDWCKENLDRIGLSPHDEIVFVSWNTGSDSFRDMQLMAQCKNLILAPRSTFSFMADMLNRNPNRLTIGSRYLY